MPFASRSSPTPLRAAVASSISAGVSDLNPCATASIVESASDRDYGNSLATASGSEAWTILSTTRGPAISQSAKTASAGNNVHSTTNAP